MLWKPMLATETADENLRFPLIALPKFDGIRGVNQNGKLYARSLKPLGNTYVSELFSGPEFDGLDGELVVGPPTAPDAFNRTTSELRRRDGQPDVTWYIFDEYHETDGYKTRIIRAQERVAELSRGMYFIERVPAWWVNSIQELQGVGHTALANGYEGLVLRDPNGLYKQGRSTEAEQGLLRWVPWLRAEATIIGVTEGEVNHNESVRDERGYLKKSSAKAGKTGSGRAGSFQVRDSQGMEFSMPVPGEAFQAEVWGARQSWVGRLVRYKFKKPSKPGGAPRYPQFEGERAYFDIGE